MSQRVQRTLLLGFAWLLIAAIPSQAQTQVTVTHTYAAKFICGVQPDAGVTSIPDAQPGRYATKINVHNNTGIDIRFRKKVIQLRGGQVPFEPTFMKAEGLRPDWAMEVVCRDIYNHLNIQIPAGTPPPHIEGFVIFEVFFPTVPTNLPDDPLDVEGIYTYYGPPFTQGVSIDVQVFPMKRNRYTIVL